MAYYAKWRTVTHDAYLKSMRAHIIPLFGALVAAGSQRTVWIKSNSMGLDSESFNIERTDGDRPNRHCCCGCHVETGANVIGLLGVVACAAKMLHWIVAGYSPGALGMAISCAVFALLLVAHCTRNASYYLPFLVLVALGLILFPLMLAFVAFGVVVFTPPDARKAILEEFGLLLLLAAIPVYGLGIWFEWVVFQAYQSMKREQ